MLYFITFLEGLISFLSPCFLPMLPVYLAYFAGDADGKTDDRRTMLHAGLFVLGFSAVFILLGVGAGTLGGLLSRHQTVLNIVCGALVVLFGLSFLEIIPLPMFKGAAGFDRRVSAVNSLLFGVIFSVSLTPCVGAFLGSALALASSQGSAAQGALLLLVYSLGMGVPLLLSALLIARLKGAFNAIKQHYTVLNRIAGGFLIVIGVLMMCGLLDKLLRLLA